ncbi:TetR/AcrR family transcriptional regulator [Marinospirillum sp. MEB164]|uniref:TetR/AcrR family transcriptional regulator n=1 Tax=Marinospirillum alkalitolerans TaxID=3123374 RepID=A0ABW8PY41_9GAMM
MTKSVPTEKQNQILKAAADAFLENGYQNTSMDHIAARAGVAKQTLYNYFGNKDTLFVAVAGQMCECEDAFMASAAVVGQDVEKVLQIYAQRKLADLSSTENSAVFRMMIAEALRFPSLGRMFFEAGMEKDRQLLVTFLQRQDAAGNLQVDDAEQAALFFQGALNAYFRPKYIMTGENSASEAIQKHIDYCIQKFLLLYRPASTR